MVDGLRGVGQNIHWITDDDSTVSTEKAKDDAVTLMAGLLHKYPNEKPQIGLGIASQFDDDRRAEDLVAIPDLAAGAFSERPWTAPGIAACWTAGGTSRGCTNGLSPLRECSRASVIPTAA